MNIIDLIILAVVGISGVLSLMRGFIRSAISLASWIFACVASFSLCGQFAGFFANYFQTPFVRTGAAFACIFIGVLVAGMIVSIVLRGIIRQVGLGSLDHLLGAIFGIMRGALFVGILILLASMTPITASGMWQQSTLLPHFNWIVNLLHDLIPKNLSSASVGSLMPNVNVSSMASSVTDVVKSNIAHFTGGAGGQSSSAPAGGDMGSSITKSITSALSGFISK